MAFACAQAQASDGIEITRNIIEASEDGYRLNANFEFQLPHGLEQALQMSVPLYFTTEIDVTRPRWWWTDERAVSQRQTVRIDYDVLTRQYHVRVMGSLQQNFTTLDEALSMIRRPSRWLFAPKGTLEPGKTYNVTLRMFLDRDFLQKPLQVNAFNNADWRLTSNKKNFTYKAE
nr:DUF4390 domain-containing protein [Massilia terrae]